MKPSSGNQGNRKSWSVVARDKNAQAILYTIQGAEADLGVSSEVSVKEASYRFAPGMDMFLVSITTAFAVKFAEKFGVLFADWLARKLGLVESEGERIKKIG